MFFEPLIIYRASYYYEVLLSDYDTDYKKLSRETDDDFERNGIFLKTFSLLRIYSDNCFSHFQNSTYTRIMFRNKFKTKVLNGEHGHYILRGGAGTGKTHTSVEIIKEHIAIGKTNIAVVAPSHKARQNFQVMLEAQGINHIKVQTVQKFLGKIPKYDFTQKDISKAEKFKRNRPSKDTSKFDLLVIDEFGMLDSKDAQSFKPFSDKRLFVGDEAQLPNPDNMSKPINVDKLLKNAKASTLLTVNHRIQNKELIGIAEIARNNPQDIKPSVSMNDALNSFLSDAKIENDIAFIVPTNEIVERISKQLNGNVNLSHNQADFNFKGRLPESAENYTVFNGYVVELDNKLTNVPDMDINGWHTPFYLNAKVTENKTLFSKLNKESEVYSLKSHPKIPFMRIYRGSLTSLKIKYIQPVWNNYRGYVIELQKKYKLDSPNDVWQVELDDKETQMLKSYYSDMMTIKNILAITDARVFTIYKAQGSTINTVYTTIPKRNSELYVAITRASHKLVIVGE